MNEKPVSKDLQDFYEGYGWRKNPLTGLYPGEVSPGTQSLEYRWMKGNELRYARYFATGGQFFLDAACGALPRTDMSKGFQAHVCVDISREGLKAARSRLGDQGRYILADLAHLPFRDGVFDGTLASHCLYHIDVNLQKPVLHELYRVTSPGRNVLVFYAARHSVAAVVYNA